MVEDDSQREDSQVTPGQNDPSVVLKQKRRKSQCIEQHLTRNMLAERLHSLGEEYGPVSLPNDEWQMKRSSPSRKLIQDSPDIEGLLNHIFKGLPGAAQCVKTAMRYSETDSAGIGLSDILDFYFYQFFNCQPLDSFRSFSKVIGNKDIYNYVVSRNANDAMSMLNIAARTHDLLQTKEAWMTVTYFDGYHMQRGVLGRLEKIAEDQINGERLTVANAAQALRNKSIRQVFQSKRASKGEFPNIENSLINTVALYLDGELTEKMSEALAKVMQKHNDIDLDKLPSLTDYMSLSFARDLVETLDTFSSHKNLPIVLEALYFTLKRSYNEGEAPCKVASIMRRHYQAGGEVSQTLSLYQRGTILCKDPEDLPTLLNLIIYFGGNEGKRKKAYREIGKIIDRVEDTRNQYKKDPEVYGRIVEMLNEARHPENIRGIRKMVYKGR